LPKPAINCANSFRSHLITLEFTRKKGEYLVSKNMIVRRDIEQIYKGLWLDACCSFEQFIEQLFIGLLVERYSHPSKDVVPRITFHSDAIATDIICSGNKYVDWLPYDRTEKIAVAYFKNGLPFKSLDQSEKNIIKDIYQIRNAVAHKSDYSQKLFQEKIIGSLALPPRDKFPAPFLRTVFRVSPSQTRYENYVIEMASIATKLCQ